MKKTNRKVVLDTETTGMPAIEGHRIIEIGCVEMLGRELTNNYYHQYLNPEREVDQGAYEVHGLGNDFLADKPVMANCIDEFLAFIEGAELIIHNATFDVGFLDYELSLLGRKERIADLCLVTDTLKMARKKHPGARANLDALTKRYGITQFNRDLHGALLDSEILAQVYLAMTGGQNGLQFSAVESLDADLKKPENREKIQIHTVELTQEEMDLHQQFFDNV